MMKKTLKLASLTFLMFGCAIASEFRPPMSADRGPQRLDMNAERESEGNWELDLYSVAYSRNANKTFTKHGSSTAPLSALIFGKDSFKVSDALTSALANKYSQEFNPNLGATILYPRVTYSEQGVNFGGKLGYRVLDGKGCVAVKVNVPLKTVRMERDNNIETNEQGFTDNVIRNVVGKPAIPTDSNAANNPGAAPVALDPALSTLTPMYRLSYVRNLPVVDAGRIRGLVDKSTANNNIAIAATAYGQDRVANFGLVAQGNPRYAVGDAIPFVLFYQPDARVVPTIENRAVAMHANVRQHFRAAGGATGEMVIGADANANQINTAILDIGSTTPAARVGTRADVLVNVPAADAPFAALTELPLDGAQLKPNVLYAPRGRNNAGDLDAYQALFDKYGDRLWLLGVAADTGALIGNGAGVALVEQGIARYGSETAEQWLWRNGFSMNNDQRTSLGDITINPCFEYAFNESWEGSVYAHVLIPTGGSKKTGYNAYKARLGNDNHVELGAGANVAWQAFDWMNVRLDAMAAYALPAKERVNAPFKGATVRGIGPVVDADINYTTLRASLDTTLVHPKASALATTLGYDFCFKTKDSATLASNKYTFKTLANDPNSWFGGFWDNGTQRFVNKEVDLDPAVLTSNTERISHVFRMESSWHATEQLSVFCGASAPLWGQYVAKMSEVHGGMNVKF